MTARVARLGCANVLALLVLAAPAAGVSVTEVRVAGAQKAPNEVVAGPGGVLLLGASSAGVLRVGQTGAVSVLPGTGEISNVTTGAVLGAVTGPDGNLWFLGAVPVVSRGEKTFFPAIFDGGNLIASVKAQLPSQFPQPRSMAVMTDGTVWVSGGPGTLYRYGSDGKLTSTELPDGFAWPVEMLVGPDGALWMTGFQSATIGRFSSEGKFTEYDLPGGPFAQPYGLALGPDGALWFTEQKAGRIGRITMSGQISEYPVGAAGSEPRHIVLGPDGAMWFTDPALGAIGRITTGGQVSEYPVPTPNAVPDGIALGAAGILWFSEESSTPVTLGRIDPNAQPAASPVKGPVKPARARGSGKPAAHGRCRRRSTGPRGKRPPRRCAKHPRGARLGSVG
jgi:streptogramin lyase